MASRAKEGKRLRLHPEAARTDIWLCEHPPGNGQMHVAVNGRASPGQELLNPRTRGSTAGLANAFPQAGPAASRAREGKRLRFHPETACTDIWFCEHPPGNGQMHVAQLAVQQPARIHTAKKPKGLDCGNSAWLRACCNTFIPRSAGHHAAKADPAQQPGAHRRSPTTPRCPSRQPRPGFACPPFLLH